MDEEVKQEEEEKEEDNRGKTPSREKSDETESLLMKIENLVNRTADEEKFKNNGYSNGNGLEENLKNEAASAASGLGLTSDVGDKSDNMDSLLTEIERKEYASDAPASTSFRPSSSSSSLNNGNSFKQLQYQLRQQRHQQQYQPIDPEVPVQAPGLSSYRPNLHLEMSSLANSVSIHSPPHTSYSLAHMSVRELSLAQAMTGKGDPMQVTPEVEYDDSDAQQELLTDKAVTVIRRVMDKLTGLDFYDPASLAHPVALDVPEQVDRLIIQATANENLCLSFLGWCPFW